MAALSSLFRDSSRFSSLVNASPLFKRFNSTVDESEMNKFSLTVAEWWNDVNGPAAPLHSMNSVRVPLIKEALLGTRDLTGELGSRPLTGYRLLDVGCGGGILCESLGTLGARVTGIDPNPVGISVAEEHLSFTNTNTTPGISDLVNYQCTSIENITISSDSEGGGGGGGGGDVSDGEGYDCVIASEVIEHVSDVDQFVDHLCQLVKPGGSIFFSTINRTLPSLLLAKMAAEYLLRIIPAGTHDWNKFITPEELKTILVKNGFATVTVQGLSFNPFTYNWSYQQDTNLNYALHAFKK